MRLFRKSNDPKFLKDISQVFSFRVRTFGDTPAGGVEYLTCFAVASLLFLITLSMNILGQRIIQNVGDKGGH